MTLTRGYARNAATTPLDARLMDMSGMVCDADGSPRAGVIGGHNLSIVSTTGTMNVAIAAAEFATTKGKADGVMLFTNDGTVNLLLDAAPASNSRIDVIYVKHNDNTTGDSTTGPVFAFAKGATAASPVKPAIPTGALELATIRIYSGTTATNGGANLLTNTYAMTASRGGVVPFRTKVELDAWTTASPGQRALVLASGREYARVGANWVTRSDVQHQGLSGSAIPGIPITPGAVDLPNGFIEKSGMLVASTSLAFGNEYFPAVNFSTPFPTACLGVTFTPVTGAPVTSANGNTIATDDLQATRFRALVPGSGGAAVRGFVWRAVGY